MLSTTNVSGINLKNIIADTEDKVLTIALARTKGNKTAAAKLLGLSLRTVHRRIDKRIQNDR